MKKIKKLVLKIKKLGLYFALLTLFFLPFNLASAASAKNITLIYTGDTHAMLYTCSCPLQIEGGVARRATLIKELRRVYPGALFLDTGAFFAGGLMDEHTQNTDLDKARTLINLKALDLMKYDALAIGSDEFNFGREFFEDAIGKTSLKLLSSNVKIDKVSPYLIKEVSGVKIGLIGVTDLAAKQKAGGIEVLDPKSMVESAVREARKNGANIIVLLSHLGEKEDLNLIKEVVGIDVVIIGNNRAKEEPSAKVENTLILRPAWQGRRLGVVNLEVKDDKIVNFKAEELRLSDKVPDDAEMLKILPKCFSDKDCKNKGSIGICQNPASLKASCLFKEPNKINLTVITSKDCLVCNAENTINALKKTLPGLTISYLYYPDKKSEKIVKDLSIAGLPAYLIGKEIEKEEVFPVLKTRLEQKGDYYLLKPEFGGLSYYLNRKKESGKLDLFLSLYDKDSSKVLEVMKEFKPILHFAGIPRPEQVDVYFGDLEMEEYQRCVCVQKHFPEYFWDYLSCRSKNIYSSWWEDCLGKYNSSIIKTCARSEEGMLLLKENINLNGQLQLMFGPAYLIDNQQIFSSKGAPSREELKKILKR